MRSYLNFFPVFIAIISITFLVACGDTETSDSSVRLLVFSKTTGWVHDCIPAANKAMMEIGAENGYKVDTTKDASLFKDENLKKYSAVIFLCTSEEVLNADQQVAFMRYIQAGGGFVGVHSAADTEYEWPWYNKLQGAYFLSHPNNPNVRKATVNVIDTAHISTKGLPAKWERNDEWYNYKNIDPTIVKVAMLDETSYEGGENGNDHPIAWYHEFDGGRSFYTGGGHTIESYSEPLFRKHLLGGIKYAIGNNPKLDYSKSYAVKIPEDNRFTKTVLSNDLNEPMQLAVAHDGRVFFVERTGNFYQYDPKTKTTDLLRKFPVMLDGKKGGGNGLLGVTIDPDFKNNNFIYFFYTPAKEPASQYVSRFVIKPDGQLDIASEKVIIEIPIDLEQSAHTGSSMDWDKHGNLFISTGDNTNPFESEGYAPIDERAKRLIFDAQRSSGNTNDLRGKVLRIHPEPDGTYTIPEGNLFPKGTPQTRPEIYIMGCRNPYRISVDPETSILYWGEIGPDAGKDAPQGPKGYDEFNQARKAGNYGWPYFVGNNIAYHEFDFINKNVGDLFKVETPENNSPNNTGLKSLPPAQPPMIWYPYDISKEFPILGKGGRSAIAGPVYHFNKSLNSSTGFPEYYDKGVFFFDWMRNWVYVVRLDDQQNFVRLEQFMSTGGDFRRPIDMKFGPDGTMYLLEYGSVYGIDNVDARLVKIEYNEGNRPPLAQISGGPNVGHAPLEVQFYSHKCKDYDGDELTYEYRMEGKVYTQKTFKHTFGKNGVYPVVLTVKDPGGLIGTDTLEIKVGNTLPDVHIASENNRTFFFPKSKLGYNVEVKDEEDASIDQSRIQVTMKYIPDANPLKVGHQNLDNYNAGKNLMEGSDCKACHQMSERSVGPAFIEVSKKYTNDKTAVERLANKIINGGGGVWGEHAMNAHPQLSKEDAGEIVKYVLSLGKDQNDTYPPKGSLSFDNHKPGNAYARYVITASYIDGGGQAKPLKNQDVLILRPARVEAEYADRIFQVWNGGTKLEGFAENSYFMLRRVDLKEVKRIVYYYTATGTGNVKVHKGSPNGPVVSKAVFASTGDKAKFQQCSGAIAESGEIADLYFVFHRDGNERGEFLDLDWIEFSK